MENGTTPTLHTVLLQLLEEADGEENTDFAEEEDEEDLTTLVPTSEENEKASPRPSRFFIAEQMRMALENVIELETLVKCYNVVQVGQRNPMFHKRSVNT